MRNAPRQYGDYLHQVTSLITTAQQIQRIPALQVEDIYCNLTAILIEGQELQSVLDQAIARFSGHSVKWKYWAALKGSDQRKIATHMESLQQQKTVLLLSIGAAKATQMSSIQPSVDQLDSSLNGERHVSPG